MRKVEKIPLSAAAFPVDGRRKLLYNNIVPAGMAELADAPDLGSGGALHAGSTPVARTSEKRRLVRRFFRCFFVKEEKLRRRRETGQGSRPPLQHMSFADMREILEKAQPDVRRRAKIVDFKTNKKTA